MMKGFPLASLVQQSCIHAAIDSLNSEFINHNKSQLRDLSPFSTASLEWLMLEHYQFSFNNTKFLAKAATSTEDFDTRAVHEELRRNLAEENDHAAIYKSALKKIHLDVDERIEFTPTTHFLTTIDQLSSTTPSAVLGTMFATETAAIFEHEVFKDVSEEVLRRRELKEEGKQLVWFHDMHLSGVEQSHRNELGIFLEGLPFNTVVEREDSRPTINTEELVDGAEKAIDAMSIWWTCLLTEVQLMSKKP